MTLFPARSATGRLVPYAARWIGLAATLAVVALALSTSGSPATFVEPFQLVLVAALVTGGLWTAFGPVNLLHAAGVAFRGRAVRGHGERRMLVALFGRGRQLAWGGGALAALIGCLVALAAVESPGQLASACARASLGVLYGALLAELVFASLQCRVALTRERA